MRTRHVAIFLLVTIAAFNACAEDIEGVQPAAVDQPRVNVVIRRSPKGPIFSAKSSDAELFNIEAFLDTGASSIMISPNTAQKMGIAREKHGVTETRFEDVGVGGGSQFAVSEPLFLSIAPCSPGTDTEHKDLVDGIYTQTVGPVRTEVGPLNSGLGFLEAMMVGDMDVVGTPALQGKTIVMDAKDANHFTDKIRTYLYNPGAQIPKVKRHVKLSFANFKDFTRTIPARDAAPAIFPNPFIGPAPFHPAGIDHTPPVIVKHLDQSSSGSWLLDTGAVASMISRKQAAAIGITYTKDTFGTDHPRLDGVPADRQFVMTVAGVGGSKKAAGTYLDSLTLQTREGNPLVFIKAPVLVNDIVVKDSAGKEFTLDGVFGMNFLVGSAKIDEGSALPDIDKLTPGAFRIIEFDQPNAILGLD